MPTDPNAQGKYSQGGFKGKASQKGAKWTQKGGDRPSKQEGVVAKIVKAVTKKK